MRVIPSAYMCYAYYLTLFTFYIITMTTTGKISYHKLLQSDVALKTQRT